MLLRLVRRCCVSHQVVQPTARDTLHMGSCTLQGQVDGECSECPRTRLPGKHPHEPMGIKFMRHSSVKEAPLWH